jgi:hypothetical protein
MKTAILLIAAGGAALLLAVAVLDRWLRPKMERIRVPESDPRLGEHASLSKDFDALLRQAGGRPMTVGTMMDSLALRGDAFLLLFFSLPLCLPVGIPVLTTILGPVLVFVSFFLLLGRRTWLPKRVRDHEVPFERMESMIRRMTPLVLRIEKHLYPRLLALSEPGLAVRVHAAYILVLALVVSLPMPILFANLVAAVPILLLSLGLIKRDGLFIIAAYVAVIPCVALYASLALLGIQGMEHLFRSLV